MSVSVFHCSRCFSVSFGVFHEVNTYVNHRKILDYGIDKLDGGEIGVSKGPFFGPKIGISEKKPLFPWKR